ncbi:hypothetical protein PR048_028103 [Dryococelus australis]|uniref:Uncharacterized protein n=1 Tax=Dryococelus australis TaxID=614101 RepID=A0ABQ9GID7_9NEOP|nr:hypothetical protein PR048_028103 [Dryococelus australis]
MDCAIQVFERSEPAIYFTSKQELARNLQTSDISIASALRQTEIVMGHLTDLRPEEKFTELWRTARPPVAQSVGLRCGRFWVRILENGIGDAVRAVVSAILYDVSASSWSVIMDDMTFSGWPVHFRAPSCIRSTAAVGVKLQCRYGWQTSSHTADTTVLRNDFALDRNVLHSWQLDLDLKHGFQMCSLCPEQPLGQRTPLDVGPFSIIIFCFDLKALYAGQWSVVKCCKVSWCLLTAVHSRCTQQEPVTTVQPRETERIPTNHKRAARDQLHASCGVSRRAYVSLVEV